MYVRKFEADTLEDALKSIKQELGPDAIILKTITNKGLKGAFKKKKIEITAAISEKNYGNKMNVEKGLNEEQKEQFYANDAGYISKKIKDSARKREQPTHASNYGSMGLNKSVSTIKNISGQIKNGFDDFLNAGVEKVSSNLREVSSEDEIEVAGIIAEEQFKIPTMEELAPTPIIQNSVQGLYNVSDELVQDQNFKIEELEKKLFELTRNVEKIDKKEPYGIYNLRTTLRSMEISESYLQGLMKKILFEFPKEDLENFDIIFEFALRDMMSTFKTEMPLFSSVEVEDKPVITIFISDSSCGQSTMTKKIASLKSDVKYISLQKEGELTSFAEKIFKIDAANVTSIPEVISEIRKAVELGKSVIVDFKTMQTDENDTKKFVESIKRTFDNVEVLVSLSAIHTELYNMKVLNKYKTISDGIVLSNLDLCLNFGALFNLSQEFQALPYKFYGTGEVVPDDIESATAERILAGIFQFD